jgi:hypothetical protein
MTFDDAPAVEEGEEVRGYFERTKDYWLQQAQSYSNAESLGLSARKLEKLAREMCTEHCEDR